MSLLPEAARQKLPAEDQIPVHAASKVGAGRHVVEVVHVDHVDNRGDDGLRVLVDSVEEGFQPALVALDVTVQEGQDRGRGQLCPADPRPDQALSLGVPYDGDLLDLGDVLPHRV